MNPTVSSSLSSLRPAGFCDQTGQMDEPATTLRLWQKRKKRRTCGGAGWSGNWRVAQFSRTGRPPDDAPELLQLLQMLMRKCTKPALSLTHWNTHWNTHTHFQSLTHIHTPEENHCSAGFSFLFSASPCALFCVKSCCLVCAASWCRHTFLQTSDEVTQLKSQTAIHIFRLKCENMKLWP